MQRIEKLLLFLEETIEYFLKETIEYFLKKIEGIDRDRYFADRDIRNILDKTINDIILSIVDISEELLRLKGRNIPETYKDTILYTYEILGEISLKLAPLVKHRNELIHQYLKINWQNILILKEKIPAVKEFLSSVRKTLCKE